MKISFFFSFRSIMELRRYFRVNWICWLIVIVLLTILEVGTTNLVSVWFIASALLSLILSFFIDSFMIEFAVFVIIGVLLMITTKPYLVKKLQKNTEPTNLDRVIGMTGIVTEDISKNKIGEVYVDGKKWSAIADEKITKDTTVKILDIEGVKLKVKKED